MPPKKPPQRNARVKQEKKVKQEKTGKTVKDEPKDVVFRPVKAEEAQARANMTPAGPEVKKAIKRSYEEKENDGQADIGSSTQNPASTAPTGTPDAMGPPLAKMQKREPGIMVVDFTEDDTFEQEKPLINLGTVLEKYGYVNSFVADRGKYGNQELFAGQAFSVVVKNGDVLEVVPTVPEVVAVGTVQASLGRALAPLITKGVIMVIGYTTQESVDARFGDTVAARFEIYGPSDKDRELAFGFVIRTGISPRPDTDAIEAEKQRLFTEAAAKHEAARKAKDATEAQPRADGLAGLPIIPGFLGIPGIPGIQIPMPRMIGADALGRPLPHLPFNPAAAANPYGDLPAAQSMGLSMNQMLAAIRRQSNQLSNQQIQSLADQAKIAFSEEHLSKMPKTRQPSAISTKLLSYQLQGLAWLLAHEHPTLPVDGGDAVQFWVKKNNDYQNTISTTYTAIPPKLASGGILADDMGLGKTLQMISLIVADLDEHRDIVKRDHELPCKGKPTLIVAPKGVMTNWSEQIEQHVRKKLRVLTYYGNERKYHDRSTLLTYDVVITSYQTLANERHIGDEDTIPAGPHLHNKGLFSIPWRRVILDEAHFIRNPKTASAVASRQLVADSRWSISGTPIFNTLKDLYSQVAFIGLSGGVELWPIFNRVFVKNEKNPQPQQIARVQELMKGICLRRLKSMEFVNVSLPTKEEIIHHVEFTDDEKRKYDILADQARTILKRVKNDPENVKMMYILEKLLRMRQVCNHWKMAGDTIDAALNLEHVRKVTYNEENKKLLQQLLKIRIDCAEECPICMEVLGNDSVITVCKHVFCRGCISQVLDTQKRCPMCRLGLEEPADQILTGPDADHREFVVDEASSSKIKAILELLTTAREKEASTKTILFSQWITFLDMLEPHLIQAGFKFTRLDGSMSVTERDAAISELSNNPTTTILLASLGACSVGLNLVAANQVILSDSWWAPAIEDQAVDRVYRIGQTREVKVFRMVVKGTIEDRVLEIQRKKRELVAGAFGETVEKRGRGERLREIERLLG